jgi:hypothetical protein
LFAALDTLHSISASLSALNQLAYQRSKSISCTSSATALKSAAALARSSRYVALNQRFSITQSISVSAL